MKIGRVVTPLSAWSLGHGIKAGDLVRAELLERSSLSNEDRIAVYDLNMNLLGKHFISITTGIGASTKLKRIEWL